MIKIISDENKGVMVDASGRIDTIATEIVAAIQQLCDDIIKKDGREVGLAFSEAIISAPGAHQGHADRGDPQEPDP